MIDNRIIEEIISSNDIVSTIEQYIPLKKTGANFKACCPFHEEKTPSFVVSDKKQIFKCFGCGKGGNVLTFIKEIEKISYSEAIRKLAAKAGIQLSRQTKKGAEKKSRISLLSAVYELAKDYYKENLQKFGDNVIEYLEQRQVPRPLAEKLELGYALNSKNGLYNYLLKNNINKDIISESGLVVSGKYGVFDLFRERLVFPIHSSTGKVVAFGARVLSSEQPGGKYINSPTTKIYTKGNELYGFYTTRTEIGRKNAAIITEGYLDFIRLYECGFHNCAAALGTSLTDKQIGLISRYTSNFYLLFDSDKAGRKASVEASKKVSMNGGNPYIVELGEETDADSFLCDNPADEMQRRIDEAKPFLEYLSQNELLELTLEERLNHVVETIAGTAEQLTSELFAKKAAAAFDVSQQAIMDKAYKMRRPTYYNKKTEAKQDLVTGQYPEERMFLVHLLNGTLNESESLNEIASDMFFNETYKKIFELFVRGSYNIDTGYAMSMMDQIESEDSGLADLISELQLEQLPEAPIESLIIDLKLRKLKTDLAVNSNNLATDNEKELAKRVRVLEEQNEQLKRFSRRVVKKIL